MVLHGIAVPLVAGSDFVGGEFTLTLWEGPPSLELLESEHIPVHAKS